MPTSQLPEGAIAYTTLPNKRECFGEGPWVGEPDKVQWVDPESDLDCLLHRNQSGAWCGYVGVPPSHPFYKKPYDEVPVSVHGGLTYADLCQEDVTDAAHGICHVPPPGREPHVWWLGFDCSHAGDVMPSMQKFMEDHPDSELRQVFRRVERYWTTADAIEEVRHLAHELSTARGPTASRSF